MKNRLIFITLIALIITQLILPFPNAYADDERNVMDLDPPLAGITGSIFKAYDNITGEEVEDYNNIPQNATILISYEFVVYDAANPADDVKSGDFFSIALPASLTDIASFDPITDRPIEIEWQGDTYTIAYLNITASGIATITFAPDVETLSDVSANFLIDGHFLEENIGNESGGSFQLYAEGTIFEIGFEQDSLPPEPIQATIVKTGDYNPAANEITWTVTVNTGDDASLDDVVVVDRLGPNQTFKSTSIDSDKVSINDDGDYVFDLGSVTSTKTFIIKTTPTEEAFGAEQTTKILTNETDLYVGALDEPTDTDDAQVSITTDWLRKSGTARQVDGVYYIDWTITLNNNNRIIPAGSTVTDSIPSYLELDLSTFKRNGQEPATFNDSVSFNAPAFTYTFNPEGGDIEGIQTISFTTKVADSYFQQQSQTYFFNTGTLNIGDDSYSDASGNVSVGTSLLYKSGKGYDASNQLITWELEVNRNGREITNATIVDTLGNKQILFEDFIITRRDGAITQDLTRVYTESEVNNSANQYYYNQVDKVITIFLGDLTGDDHPYITFKTKVTDPNDFADNKSTTYRNNSAVLTGGGIMQSAITNTSQNVNSQVIAKTSTGYDYVTRILSWKIVVNQNNMVMPDAVITDTVPDGQAFIEGSFLIDSIEPGDKLELDGNNFTIHLGEISNQVVITFDTIVTDLSVFLSTNGNVVFQNDATLNSGITGAPSVTVRGTREVLNKAIEKNLLTEYNATNGFIGWEVFINSNQVMMENACLADTLEEGLELDTESVELYYWNQDSAGNHTIGGQVPAEDFSFTYDFSTRLFLMFLPDGAQGYYMKFNTDVLAPGKYSNTISFTGSYIGSDSASSGYTVTGGDITASGSGWNGSVIIQKSDENGVPIAEPAEFELLDSMKIVKAALMTDSNGRATFNRLKLRTYYIREVKAPLGYVLDNSEIEVVLTNDTPETRNQTINVRNYMLRADIIMQKQDEQGNVLSGGLFSIYDSADTDFSVPLQTVSAENGLVRFSNLLPGEYNIKEILPPQGYYLTDTVINVSLLLDTQNNTLDDLELDEPLINNRIIGAIELQKVDTNNKPLQGARFGLYNGSGVFVDEAVSDDEGIVLFSDVPYGTYTVKELAAPDGYRLTGQTISVNVVSDGITKTVPYNIINVSSKLPKTGGFWDTALFVTLGALLIVAGNVILLYRKLKNEQ